MAQLSRRNLKIKKGDVVRVIAGKDKGAEGKVIAVQSQQDRVIVEGINRIKRHTKVVNQGGRAGTTGGIVTQEAAIHVSNVMLLVDAPKDAKSDKADKDSKGEKSDKGDDKAEKAEKGEKARGKVTTRVGYRRDEVTKRRPDGSTYTAQRSTRIARKSGEEI
jgi:large subunit ribosomal protein L24